MKNRSSIFAIIALIIGASGLGLGVFSVVNFQIVEGPQGAPGQDGQDGIDGVDGVNGTDGKDAPGGIVVGILDPDNGQTISGVVKIRALVYGTELYSISILRNGTEIGTTLPYDWDTLSVSDDWYNITVIVTDAATNNVSQDEVIVYVLNLDDPTNIYYCSSGLEVQEALTAIGTSSGTIMITQSITLDQTIEINGTGSYIIQGVGSITVDCNGDRTAFYVTSATTCTIRDLKIDCSDITYMDRIVIQIDENSNNPIYIENMQIIGDTDRYGRGVYIMSNNVWISDCYFYQINNGIVSYGIRTHIYDNTFVGIAMTGVSSSGSYNVIEGNSIQNTLYGMGIGIVGSHCIIANNIIVNPGDEGIYFTGSGDHGLAANNIIINPETDGIGIIGASYIIITGNSITGAAKDDTGYRSGIRLSSDADYNILDGNRIFGFQNTGSGWGYGIRIQLANCDENTVVGNTALNNEVNFDDNGTNTFGDATLNNFG
ncbi:MAG: right-handed parallel beta-helix repeat-containing protein [Candidatus Hodarchaeota archaeon]